MMRIKMRDSALPACGFIKRLAVMTLFFALSGALGPMAEHARAESRNFRVAEKESRVLFQSEARLETFNGVAEKVRGAIALDPDDLRNASGSVRVDVRSMKTGIKLRDEHLQSSNWLDAERYPEIVFMLDRIVGAQRLVDKGEVNLRLEGKFSLHGITKPMTVDAKVRYDASKNEVVFMTRFKVKLEDYGISIPTLVALKVAREITVRATIVAR